MERIQQTPCKFSVFMKDSNLVAPKKKQVHHSGAVKHFVQCYDCNRGLLRAYAIEAVSKPIRGGNWRQKTFEKGSLMDPMSKHRFQMVSIYVRIFIIFFRSP